MSDPSPPSDSASGRLSFAAAGRLLRSSADEQETAPPCDSASDASLPGPPPGYRIERLLGAGGGGVVYLAFRDGSERALALKVLRAMAGDSRSVRRAWRELDLLDSLHLAAVPRLIDYGQFDGHLFFTTEFVPGMPLDLHADQARLDRRGRVELLARAADAVQLLNERGIIHRDLKPSNIIVPPDGNPMIVDLGLAHIMTVGGETLTTEGTPLGTPAFMAPEQARGENSAISTRADVFGLAATGYKLLTGDTPFDTDSSIHEAIRRVAFDQPREPRALDPALPRPLAAVLFKAASRDPGARYTTAAEFAADLRRFLRAEPVEAGTPGALSRLVRFALRRPILITAAACLLIALGTVLFTAFFVHIALVKPDRLVATENPTTLSLLSRGGRVLHTWRPPEGGLGNFIDFTTRSDGEPRRLILTVLPFRSGHNVVRSLTAWTFERTPRKVWELDHPGVRGDLHPVLAAEVVRQHAFMARPRFILADIFPEDRYPDCPGPEIVAAFNVVGGSTTALVVLDGRGRVRYQIWHHGVLEHFYWAPESRILLACGDTTDYYLNQLVPPDHASDEWLRERPLIVFAVRPELDTFHGCINYRYTTETSPATHEDTLVFRGWDSPAAAPLWYKLFFCETFAGMDGSLLELSWDYWEHPDGPRLRSVVRRSDSGVGVHLSLDPRTGDVLRRSTSDRFKTVSPSTPPESFDLIDFPSIRPDLLERARQAGGAN